MARRSSSATSYGIAVLAVLSVLALVQPVRGICKFPPQGALLSHPNITIFGSQTLRAFGSGYRVEQGAKPGVEGPWLAPIVTGCILFAQTAYALLIRPKDADLFYYLVSFYPTTTGVVELIRANWDGCRFGFVTAAWHNLPEYYMIMVSLLGRGKALKRFPYLLLYMWVLNVTIMFIPSLDGKRSGLFFAGLVEQLTGICCDHLLMYLYAYLWYNAPKGSATKKAYFYALLGSGLHMLEIGPLVILLVGVVSRPFIPISVLVALTEPVTFWFYTKFLENYQGDARPAEDKKPIPARPGRIILVVGIILGLTNILGPATFIPDCTGPMELLPEFNTANPQLSTAAQTCPAPTRPPVGIVHPTDPGTPYTGPMCPSSLVLTGMTTVTARPGRGQDLISAVATMPGPIHQEDGSMGYDVFYDGNNTVKFKEVWSSIRTLYKHIFLSPTVRRVFYSPAWNQIKAHQVLEGPFQTMLPCPIVAEEPKPVEYVFSVTLDAPIECVWDRISDWSNDVSWIQGALGVTAITPNLRVVRFATLNITETRQTKPLLGVDQPEGGHRLIYYVLDGFLIPEHAEVYKGEITLLPASRDPSKTVYSYRASVIPRNTSQADYVYQTLSYQYTQVFPKSLQNWAQSLQCRENAEYYYQFILPPNFPKYKTAAELLTLLTGNKSASLPKIRFAADVWTRYSSTGVYLHKPTVLKSPDFTKNWNVALGLEFPPDCAIRPESVGEGIALDSFRLQVKSKPLPLKADVIGVCNNAVLAKEEVLNTNATDAQVRLLSAVQAAALASPDPPLVYEEQASGQNLNKYKPGYGKACYQLYLTMVMSLFRPRQSVIQYYAEVIKDPKIPEEEQWDEIVIPTYYNVWALYEITTQPAYREEYQVRLAGLADTVNYGFTVLPGSRPAIV